MATIQVLDATSTPQTAALVTNTGQTTMADSLPVVIANDQSAVPVSGPLTDAELRATAVPVSGPLTDAELRATAVPVSGPLTDAQLTAAALATDTVVQAIRDRLPSAFLTPDLLPVDSLATLGVARQLAAGAASVNTALTASCRRISIAARTADIRYVIGTGSQTASATSHWIAAGERIDLDVPASANIAVIRADTTDGTLELSELT